jgi:glutathione S-transferase
MLVLHHCHESRSMRSLWLLNELGLDFELRVYPFGPELRSPEYLAKHPLGRVPSLEHDGRILFETGAITEYLCETFRQEAAGLFRAPGDPERADWLQWLHFAETVAVHGAALTQQHVVLFEDSMRSPVIMKLERRRLEKALEVLDRHLAGREYLLQTGFSAVDTNVGYSVYIARFFTPLELFPNLSAYYGRLEQRPAFRASRPEGPAIYHKPFYDLPEQQT